MLIRKNKRGQEFIGCSNYPSCRYVESMNQPEEPSEEKFCPECGAKMVVKYSRRGRFWGCSNYPNCNHMEPYRKKNVSKN